MKRQLFGTIAGVIILATIPLSCCKIMGFAGLPQSIDAWSGAWIYLFGCLLIGSALFIAWVNGGFK